MLSRDEREQQLRAIMNTQGGPQQLLALASQYKADPARQKGFIGPVVQVILKYEYDEYPSTS